MPWRSLRSPPAQNALSPAPVRTMQRWAQRVGVDRVEERQQVAAHLRVHRIGDLRPVEGQQQQALAAILDPDRLVFADSCRISAPSNRPGL